MKYERELEVRYEPDILVVGGGPAGVCAAIAAARAGADVLLCEAGGCLGGAGTAGLVPAFATFTDGKNMLVGGIGLEIRNAACPDFPPETRWTPIEPERLKRVYDEKLTESGARFIFFAKLCDALSEGRRITACIFSSREGMFAVRAKQYIDCTGDGELNALAGGEFELGDENGNVMPSTLCSSWNGVDYGEYSGASVPDSLERAISDGVFTYADRHLTGLNPREGGICGGNIGHVFDCRPLDDRSVTEAMVWARRSMLEYERFYREYVSGCGSIRLVATANMLGVRESRRTRCEYTLTADDYANRASFPDEIGRYCYPIDIHIMSTDPDEMERFRREHVGMRYADGESYGIPLRSLIAASFDNLLTAGRCIGADRQMQSSVRVMPCCFLTGEAAGIESAKRLHSA